MLYHLRLLLQSSFVPISAALRRYHSEHLDLSKPKSMKARRPAAALDTPKLIDAVRGDGNCFFRVTRTEVTGTETNHTKSAEYCG